MTDADTYVKKYFSNHDDPSLAKKLIKNLRKNPQLRELTANPLNTALLCLICEDTQGKLPYNKTMLYREIVSCALMRNFQKKGIPLVNADPIEVCSEQLNRLGELALEALVRDQLYFTTEKLRGHSTEFLDFGLLSREASASKIRPKPSYAFTHKTFQEYFAAFHVAHELLTGGKDKAALLTHLTPPDKYWPVWEFLITMASKRSDDVAVVLVSSLCASFQNKMPKHFSLHYYYEPEEEASDDEDDSAHIYPGYQCDNEIDSGDCDSDDDLDNDLASASDVDTDNRYDYGFDANVCRDDSFDWPTKLGWIKWSKRIEEDVVTNTIFVIAQCEQPEGELKDYQKKMASELARCFPLDKVTVSHWHTHDGSFFARRYFQVFSEYLKVHCQVTGLLWFAELNEVALAAIERILRSSDKLTYLHLCDDLRSTSLTPALQANRTLTHLNLRNARIRIAGAKALGEVLRLNCTLTHVSLPGNAISHIGAEAIAKGLEFNNVLVHLDIRDNWIGDQGAVAFAEAFESNSTLKYFDVGMVIEMQFKPDFYRPKSDFDDVKTDFIRDSGIKAIAKSLRSNCSLTYLDVHGNPFGDSSGAALGEAPRSNCTLNRLYLKGSRAVSLRGTMKTQFGNLAAAAFKRALQSRVTKVTHLDLCNTSMTSSCVISLAEALQSNITLVRLDLSCNSIDSFGAAAMANGLKSNRTLTHLQLRGNHISDDGAAQFAQCLRSNRTLVYLDLIGNSIKCLGATAIAQALKSNKTLTHLQLGWNKVGDSRAVEFADTLQCNKSLVFLSLKCNQFSESGRSMLKQIKPFISCSLRI